MLLIKIQTLVWLISFYIHSKMCLCVYNSFKTWIMQQLNILTIAIMTMNCSIRHNSFLGPSSHLIIPGLNWLFLHSYNVANLSMICKQIIQYAIIEVNMPLSTVLLRSIQIVCITVLSSELHYFPLLECTIYIYPFTKWR